MTMWLLISRVICLFLGLWIGKIIFGNDRKDIGKPCEDAISREEAIRVAEQGQIQGYEWQFKKLCNLPSVTPQQKIGKWLAKSFHEVYCDNCGFDFDIMTNEFIDKMKYCPSCGACMVESEGEE